MSTHKKILGLAFFLSACLSVCGLALAAEKIGYVEVAKLFDQYEKTKEFDKSLELKVNAYEKDKDSKVAELKQLQDKLSLLSDKEKDKTQKELEDKVKSVREFALSEEGKLKQERDERLKEILKDIEDSVKEYASRDGYTMIFNDKVFVHVDKSYDVTNKVLEILKSKYKKK